MPLGFPYRNFDPAVFLTALGIVLPVWKRVRRHRLRGPEAARGYAAGGHISVLCQPVFYRRRALFEKTLVVLRSALSICVAFDGDRPARIFLSYLGDLGQAFGGFRLDVRLVEVEQDIRGKLDADLLACDLGVQVPECPFNSTDDSDDIEDFSAGEGLARGRLGRGGVWVGVLGILRINGRCDKPCDGGDKKDAGTHIAPHRLEACATSYWSLIGMSSKGATRGIVKLIFFTSAGGAGYFPHQREVCPGFKASVEKPPPPA